MGQHTDLQEIQDVMDTEDTQELPEAAVDQTAKTHRQFQQPFDHGQTTIST